MKHYIVFALLLISLPLPPLVLSLSDVNPSLRHFVPVISLGIIAIAYLLSLFPKLLRYGIVGLFLLSQLHEYAPKHFEFHQRVRTATTITMETLRDIRNENHYDKWDFFQTKTLYLIPSSDPQAQSRVMNDWLLWPMLVKQLDNKFFVNVPNSSYPKNLNSDDYIILTCYNAWIFSPTKTNEACKNVFMSLSPAFQFEKIIHESEMFSLLLFAKK